MPGRQVDIANPWNSAEYRQHFVDGLFQELLGRKADSAGLDFFAGAMASGLTNDQIIGDVMGSTEYFQRTTVH